MGECAGNVTDSAIIAHREGGVTQCTKPEPADYREAVDEPGEKIASV